MTRIKSRGVFSRTAHGLLMIGAILTLAASPRSTTAQQKPDAKPQEMKAETKPQPAQTPADDPVKLKALKNLQVLALSCTEVTAAGLDALKDIKSLKSIYLIGTKVTPQAIDKLKQAMPGVAVYKLWLVVSCQSKRTCGLLTCIHHHHRPLTRAAGPRACVSLFRTAPKDR